MTRLFEPGSNRVAKPGARKFNSSSVSARIELNSNRILPNRVSWFASQFAKHGSRSSSGSHPTRFGLGVQFAGARRPGSRQPGSRRVRALAPTQFGPSSCRGPNPVRAEFGGGVLQAYYGCTTGALWVYYGCTTGALRVYYGCTTGPGPGSALALTRSGLSSRAEGLTRFGFAG